MSSTADAVKPAPPMMLRAEITPGEWAALRSRAALERKTTQKLIGELLRECLAKRETSA